MQIFLQNNEKSMSNLVTRTLSGAVYVALVVASIVIKPAFFGIVFLPITLLAIMEYHRLVKSHPLLMALSGLAGGGMFCTLYALNTFTDMSIMVYFAYASVICFMAALIAVLFIQDGNNAIENWGHILGSLVMIALPFSLMNYLLDTPYVLLALFITIWVNDSGAYCVGSMTAKRAGGNHKMFPRVSPAKSWEGLIGGIVFALAAGIVYWQVGWFDNMWKALGFTVVIAIFGTLGDLMESLMKRTIGVKDSGKFLPGHGGVLDRFDSILLATPAVVFYLLCCY